MDPKQQQAFEEAVERKKQEALEASQEQGHPTRAPQELGDGSQANRDDPTTTQDQPTPRHKGTRHGQMTAENWNQ